MLVATYVFLYVGFRLSDGFGTADVAVVVLCVEQGFALAIFGRSDIEQSDADAFHAEHLCHYSTQASRAAGDHDDLVIPVDLSGGPPSQEPVKVLQ